ncbi:hypothetical protein SAMN05192533_12051 [Mesobacillus persicus]|uniref:Uncharacterized protein n=1 Tax=Mesobacillus persicus TaxID=930146 RepID=A0A1H8JAL8_9BACI|nr:hypothetical protein SAMN05192533_12051 [Mesobacillus persicus]
MNEKETSYPNVQLKGKLNKQKGEKEAGQTRYGQTKQSK